MIRTVFNWLFRPVPTAYPTPRDSAAATADGGPTLALIAALEVRLSTLEKQTSDFVDLRLQWSEVLDKLQRWTNRQSARDWKRVSADLSKAVETPEDAPGPTIQAGPGVDIHQLKNSLRARLRAQNGGTR